MLTTLLLLASISAPEAVPAQEPKPARPHSSLPAWGRDAEEDSGSWLLLSPPWLAEGAPRLMDRAARKKLGGYVAMANRWEEGTAQRWLEATEIRPLQMRFRLESVAEAGSEPVLLLGGTESLWPGQPTLFSEVLRRTVVLDFDVQIAQGSAIAEPVPGRQEAGASLAVRLLPVPGAGWQAELGVVLSRFGPADPLDLGYESIQGKDRLRQEFEECGLTTFLTANEPTTLRLPGPDGSTYRLELEVGGATPPESVAAGDSLVVAAPTLAARGDWPSFVTMLEGSGKVWSSREGFLAFSDEAAELQTGVVVETAQRRSRPLAVALAVRTSDSEQPLVDFAGELVPDAPLRFATGSVFQAVTAWEVEVAQMARVPDPTFDLIHEGAQGQLTVATADGRPKTVDLDLVLRWVRSAEPQRLVLAAEHKVSAGDSLILNQPRVEVYVEQPEVARVEIQGSFVPDEDGRIVIERAGDPRLGVPGMIRVELTVTPLP